MAAVGRAAEQVADTASGLAPVAGDGLAVAENDVAAAAVAGLQVFATSWVVEWLPDR